MGGLVLRDVTVRYDDLVAVRDVSLALPAGAVLAVLGPSGCGKSTLLRAVAGLEPVASGAISYDGADLGGVPTHHRGFALMFQDGQLFAHLDVARNVGYALRLRRTPRAEVSRRVGELLELVGLAGYADRLPATLSGGERQRVALARALAVEPRLILLDEPLSALDATLRTRLATDLREILRTAGTTALMVTHDHDEAFAVADRIAVMRAGHLVQDGPIGEVWQHPVDADTAYFLGYATVLTGAEADRMVSSAGLVPGQDLALRRSALVVDDAGPLAGTAISALATPEQLRVGVEVAGLGALHAVAPLGSHVAPGDAVRLRIDASRTAPVPRGDPRVSP
ncbi:ABC transporter ATP-binding protein [uncultured Nocardioides sp.]|uniref:ABC transporter ATP-binding protein n=1 Tax=uncultured Nocardioides sp. TaxID=198441 RepID=UPI0025F30B37|nr:ABC transporter ATP-binding protein [uncultured Nocardioides sp.]